MPLLLQLSGPNSPLADPDPLPSPPLLSHYLLEDPWPAIVTLTALALILLYILIQRAQARRGLLLSSLPLLLAAGIYLLASSVQTTRELLIARTESLIRAGIAADARSVDATLRSDVTLTLLGRATTRDKAYLVALVQRDIVASYNAKETRIKWTTATLDGPSVARTQTRVIVNSPDYPPTHTTWLLTWNLDADQQWRVRSLNAQQIGFLPQGTVPDP